MIVGLALVFVGGLIVYAGVTGRSVVELLVGHHPAANTAANPNLGTQ